MPEGAVVHLAGIGLEIVDQPGQRTFAGNLRIDEQQVWENRTSSDTGWKIPIEIVGQPGGKSAALMAFELTVPTSSV